jgi:hypothetical protein
MSNKFENKGYEENDIKLGGIIGFGIGLLVLVSITFVLMAIMKNVMEDQFLATDKVDPMASTKAVDKLPPEPRLQGAPGFGVDGKDGRINLELQIPQAEYRAQVKIWSEIEENGHKDAKTGVVMTMPMKEAKEAFLQEIGKTVKVREAAKEAIESPLEEELEVEEDKPQGDH